MQNKQSFFEKVAGKPLAWMVMFYPLLLVALLIFGFFYSRNTNNILQNKIPFLVKDTLAVVPELPVAEPRVASAIDINTLTAPTPEMLAKGKELYQASCASCHGAEGKGDGVAGAALNPKPRNFHAVDGWKNGRKLTEMYKTLQFGIAGGGMGAYDYMSPSDRIDIISFIRATYMESGAPADAPADIAGLDAAYKLSLGTQIPGSLPVAGAAVLVKKSNNELQSKLVGALNKSLSIEQTVLLNKFVADKNKAFATLLNNPSWKEDKAGMIKILSMNLSKNGFKGSVVLGNDAELSALFSLMQEILG